MAVFEPEAEGIVLDAEETGGDIVGRSPWALAGRRLLRNRISLAALTLFLLIVVVSFGAPIYAHDILHGNAGTFSLLMSAAGVGAFLGALQFAARTSYTGLARWIAATCTVCVYSVTPPSLSAIFALTVTSPSVANEQVAVVAAAGEP